jgi:predicted dehydrogenase
MNVGVIGCGFVADYYLGTLAAHAGLTLLGVTDRDAERAQRVAAHYGTYAYASVGEMLEDPRVELVLNLTNPGSHYDVSKLCLEAGKHVYSEKPLAMCLDEAKELVELAESRGLAITSAPCNLLGETAQTLWKALRENLVGKVRVAYAEMDEGLVHRMPFRKWTSASGAPWPYLDEFQVGTTLEHAGYVLTWLPAFFGPALTVTGFSACLIPDKVPGESLDGTGPDFAVACISFESGVVARLTSSLIAPHDHSLRIVGDTGVLSTDETWSYGSPVRIRRSAIIRRRHVWLPRRKVPLVKKGKRYAYRGVQQMDFARGPAELAASIEEGRPCRLPGRYALHVNELVLAVQNAGCDGRTYRMTTRFDPLEPMPWAGAASLV